MFLLVVAVVLISCCAGILLRERFPSMARARGRDLKRAKTRRTRARTHKLLAFRCIMHHNTISTKTNNSFYMHLIINSWKCIKYYQATTVPPRYLRPTSNTSKTWCKQKQSNHHHHHCMLIMFRCNFALCLCTCPKYTRMWPETLVRDGGARLLQTQRFSAHVQDVAIDLCLIS